MKCAAILLLLVVVQYASAFPRVRRQTELEENDNLTPLNEHEANDEDTNDRDKRMLEGATQAKFSVKNALLGFVFGNSTRAPPAPPRRRPQNKRATPRPNTVKTTTTEDIPVFDRNRVSLQFPGEVFGPSVSLLIRSTKVIGSVIQNSAERYRTFLGLFRPFFRGAFEIKGLDPPTTTTARPKRKTTPKLDEDSTSKPLSNEIRR